MLPKIPESIRDHARKPQRLRGARRKIMALIPAKGLVIALVISIPLWFGLAEL